MADLPTGIVTFLFTDIEGSTKLWEHYPDEARLALARHDELIEGCVQQHGGVIVRPRGEGDSRFAVFAHASDAVVCAAAIQLKLAGEAWPMPEPLKVRMALHTGEADLRMGDYYGSVVNRCARLRSLAHGGQILLSMTTAELVRDQLPEMSHLDDLGEHRLKDLIRPEHIYQLTLEGLPADFPSLQTLDTYPNNLPVQLTSFIGREQEIAEIKQQFAETRLLTLTGSGGVGKTRLALQVAADMLEDFPNGAWLVELAPITDPSLATDAVANVLGVHEMPGRPLMSVLSDFLRGKRLLIILDNCEHVIDACAQLAEDVLRICPNLTILATGREALGVMGERAWRIPSLAVPDVNQLPMLEQLRENASVRLFIDRATAAKPDFEMTEQNAPAIAHICQRLDGIPLALELATTRIRGLSVEQIASRLDDRFRLLTGGSRTALPRQQTLRTLIDWSYDLLTEPERLMLRRLSVFVGGWSLEGAEAVCASDGIDTFDVLDLLLQLVNKSLVVVEERGSESRYRLLETIRQYAREKLLDAGLGEVEAARNRHLEFYAAFAVEAGTNLRGKLQKRWRRQLETEHDNIRAALEWAHGTQQVELLAQIVASLEYYWMRSGNWVEGGGWAKAAIKATTGRQDMLRAQVIMALFSFTGRALSAMLDTEEDQLFAECVEIVHKLGDKGMIAYLTAGEGFTMQDSQEALKLLQKSIALYREVGDTWGIANVQFLLGDRLRSDGDLDEAEKMYRESMALFRELGDDDLIAYPIGNLGRVAFARGDYAEARASYEESIALCREMGSKLGIADWLLQLAHVTLEQGDYARAKESIYELLPLARDIGNNVEIADCLVTAGGLALALAQYQACATLLGAATKMLKQYDYETFGSVLEPMTGVRLQRYLDGVRVQLGDSAFNAAFAKGQAMSIEQTIDYVLSCLDENEGQG